MSDIKENATMVHKGSGGRTAHFALELLTGLRCPLPEYPIGDVVADYAKSVGAHVLRFDKPVRVELRYHIPVVVIAKHPTEDRWFSFYCDSVDEIDDYLSTLSPPWEVAMIISMLPLMGKK